MEPATPEERLYMQLMDTIRRVEALAHEGGRQLRDRDRARGSVTVTALVAEANKLENVLDDWLEGSA